VARRASKVIKVYGGNSEEVNNAVREWLDKAGYMYYPCQPDDVLPCTMKRELGGNPSDTVVQKGKKSITVEGTHERYKVDVYE
jgi:hypothetical protein